MVSLRILVAAERKKEGLAMVTAMEDACPNGVREEKEEVTPPGPPGVEGPPAVQSTQEADASGGEERRRKRWGVTWEGGDTVVFDFVLKLEMEGLIEVCHEKLIT